MNDCPYDLGVFAHCPSMKFGLIAIQTGQYKLTIFRGGGYYYTFTKTFVSGAEITMPAQKLNEDAGYLLSITNPDGSVYTGWLLNNTALNVTQFTFKIVPTRTL